MKPNSVNGEPSRGPSAAPAARVTETLRVLRNRSPQQSLGVNAESGLLKAFLQSTVMILAVLAALTVGPYIWDKQHPAAAQPAKPDAVEKQEAAVPSPATTTPGPEAIAKKPVDVPKDSTKTPPKKDILDILGESGSKEGNPLNPLDKKQDDLLKDLK